MGTHTGSDVEDSRAASTERDRLPLLEGVLRAKKERRADFFRLAEVIPDRHADVLSPIVERRQSRPQRRPWSAGS
jgi:hypothetical protein